MTEQPWWPTGAEMDTFTSLTVTLDRLETQLLHEGAVILLPPDVAPDVTGFMGRSVLRVPGLAEPMVGIPAGTRLRSLRVPADTPADHP
jgi:hypothetical protein